MFELNRCSYLVSALKFRELEVLTLAHTFHLLVELFYLLLLGKNLEDGLSYIVLVKSFHVQNLAKLLYKDRQSNSWTVDLD